MRDGRREGCCTLRMALCFVVVALLANILLAIIVSNAAIERYEYGIYWQNASNTTNGCDRYTTCCECDPATMGHCCVKALDVNETGDVSAHVVIDVVHCMLPDCAMFTTFTWISFMLWVAFVLTSLTGCAIIIPRNNKRRRRRPRVQDQVQVNTPYMMPTNGPIVQEIHVADDGAWHYGAPPSYDTGSVAELTMDTVLPPAYEGTLQLENPEKKPVE